MTATKKESSTIAPTAPGKPGTLWALLCLVVAFLLAGTRAEAFFAPPDPAPGQNAPLHSEAVGKTTTVCQYDAVDSLIAAKTTAPIVEDTVSLFHQGTLRGGQVSSTRGLSTSLSSDLSHYRPGGQLYEFQVPRSTYNQWLDEGLAIPKTDLHLPTGIVTPEIRVLPPASGSLNQYLVRPPGG